MAVTSVKHRNINSAKSARSAVTGNDRNRQGRRGEARIRLYQPNSVANDELHRGLSAVNFGNGQPKALVVGGVTGWPASTVVMAFCRS